MRGNRWTLSIVLGLITGLLLLAALWPKEEKTVSVIVAARDLGAGTTLTQADLTTIKLPLSQAPADLPSDPTALIGQTLAVVRFAGEPVTLRHLGPAVTLAPDERGIAVKVKADTGLAGLLRPGMQVGVIATLSSLETGRDIYAKTVLEGLRVLYVPPDFQARPYAPATATATVSRSGASAQSSDRLGLNQGQPASTPGSSGTVREGVLVLAASTRIQPIVYETVVPLTTTAGITTTAAITVTGSVTGTAAFSTTLPVAPILGATKGKEKEPAPVQWIAPVELLAALNAGGDSLTLTLLPEKPKAYNTAGINLGALLPASLKEEKPR